LNSGRKRDDQFSELRRQAETILLDRIAVARDQPAALSASDALRALHELSVHQVELEMQQEELLRTMAELERLNQLYSAMSQVNQAIIHAATEQELLDNICEVMVVSGKFDLAWVGWRDPDTGGFRVESRYGDGAAERSSGSAVAVPLRKAGGAQGILSVHACGQDRFGDRERALLAEAAEGVSFALEHLELDAQRRNAQEALAASAAQARSMLRTARDGVWLTDAAGRFLDVNEAACRMLGYTHDELCALFVSDVEGGESREEVLRHIEKLHREGADLFESVHRRKDGTHIPVEVSVTNLPEQSCTVAYIRDISERKRWEAALLEREERYRTFFEYGPDGIVVLDPATARPIEFNDQACRQLGYTREEFRRLTLADIEASETVEETSSRIQMVLLTGIEDFETRQRTRQGEIRDVHVTAQHIRVGGVSTYHCVWRDITERKAAYARLSEANARLRSLTLELTRTEQRERHRLAQMLHDHLQQELVGATFSLETLGSQTRGRAALKTLGNLAETIRRAIDISRDLTVELSPPVFHEKGLGGGLEWLARQARKHYGLQVAVELDGNLEPDTEAVRMFVFEAVRELLLNVVKHAKAERARIRMRPHGDGGIAITVEDDGAGFDPARLETEASPAGGMGLFSIRERLRFLQGGMEIISRPGGGSSLTLVIPVRARPGRLSTRVTEGGLRDGDQDPHRR